MKKYFLMAVCIITMSMTASAITINKALLEHNGEVTLFDGNNIQDAINASVDGDIIYLTLGTFKPFNVTKKITIRGTGETSIINGDVTIEIPNSPTLTSPVLEALKVTGSVTLGSAVSNLLFRQCWFTSSCKLEGNVNGGTIEKCKIGNLSFTHPIQDLTIDRCYITGSLTLSSQIQSMTLLNSKLYDVAANTGATNNTTFVNCNFYILHTPSFSGTIINSIINYSRNNSDSSPISSTVILNSLMYGYNSCVSISSSSVAQNCYYYNNHLSKFIDSNTCNCGLDTSTLKSYGYLGTDGTVVGIYGGETPYDDNMLVPSVPKVTSSDIKLDTEKKELNVKLTVSPQ